MNRADEIAVRVKHALHEFNKIGLKPGKVLLGIREMRYVVENDHPCDPPDYVPDGERPRAFCGVECVELNSAWSIIAWEFSNI